MMRAISAAAWLGLSLVLVSCSGGKSMTGNPATPSVAGAWEFLAVSNNGGGTTGIEVALQEGTVLVDGMNELSGNVSATGSTRSLSSAWIRARAISPRSAEIAWGSPETVPGQESTASAGPQTQPEVRLTLPIAKNGTDLICRTCSVGPAGALTRTLFGNQAL